LYSGFYLLGGFDGSLQYGKFSKSKARIYFPNIATALANGDYNNKSSYFIFPYADSRLGLGWQSYFCQTVHVDLFAAYEIQFLSPGPTTNNNGLGRSPVGDSSGFNISAKVDF
jgi:hypothetical protein